MSGGCAGTAGILPARVCRLEAGAPRARSPSGLSRIGARVSARRRHRVTEEVSTMTTAISRPTTIEERIASFDWPALQQAMDDTGYATIPPLLTPDECRDLRALYDEDRHFRSRIDMARHRFGLGEYKYFAAPLPPVIQVLRAAF